MKLSFPDFWYRSSGGIFIVVCCNRHLCLDSVLSSFFIWCKTAAAEVGTSHQDSTCSFKHLISYDPFLTRGCVLLTVVLERVLSFVYLLYAVSLLPSPSEGSVYQQWDVYLESQSCKLLGVDGPLYSKLQQKQQGLGNIMAAISVY